MILSPHAAFKAALAVLAAILLLCSSIHAVAQEHRHPPQDVPLHEQFYAGWMMPDHPNKSCCNKADCYPTEARFMSGQWMAKRREDGRWLSVPANKVERNRDNPDGRNHLCAPPPNTAQGDVVFCFALGGGT